MKKIEKMMAWEKARRESVDKWDAFFESGQPLTLEKQKEMQEENKHILELDREASLEWFEMQKDEN